MSKNFIGPDLLFSYWIYVWFFIYYFAKGDSAIVQNIHYFGNPVSVFLIALAENVLTLIFLIMDGAKQTIVLSFAAMILVIKCVPLYLLRDRPITIWRDLFVLSCVFLAYNVYLLCNETNIVEIYRKTYESISRGERNTPFLYGLSLFFPTR